jgi:glucosylceramidase
VDALAPANEPVAQTAYPGMYLPSPRAVAFVRRDLRPALRRAHLHPSVFGWDLSWGRLAATNPLVRAAGAGSLRGIAWHCYFGDPDDMTALHAVAPRAAPIVDECATGAGDPWETSELEIASFRDWASAVWEWNLALDPAGGRVRPPNLGCRGCTGRRHRADRVRQLAAPAAGGDRVARPVRPIHDRGGRDRDAALAPSSPGAERQPRGACQNTSFPSDTW